MPRHCRSLPANSLFSTAGTLSPNPSTGAEPDDLGEAGDAVCGPGMQHLRPHYSGRLRIFSESFTLFR